MWQDLPGRAGQHLEFAAIIARRARMSAAGLLAGAFGLQKRVAIELTFNRSIGVARLVMRVSPVDTG
jgi:hypothetical protein